jgi:TolA-binding protein
MAEKKVIELEVSSNLGNLKQQLKQAQGDVQDLSQDFVKTSDSVKDATKKTELLNDSVKSIKDTTSGAENGFKKIKTAAVKSCGNWFNNFSFVALKSALEQNQEVAEAFSAVMETISIVF